MKVYNPAMELKEIQALPLAPAVGAPFASSWSEDNKISVITEKGIYVVDGARRMPLTSVAMFFLWLVFLAPLVSAGDITNAVFGGALNVKPAAYGDFNADELTDMFVLYGDSNMTLEVMLASEQEPLFRRGGSNYKCSFPNNILVTSVVPGNFDGDSHMDIMITVMNKTSKENNQIHILWGDVKKLNCDGMLEPVYKMRGQPIAIDYNTDMIVDLCGEESDGNRTCILFNSNRTIHPKKVSLPQGNSTLRMPHSHAFVDLNGDFSADLLLSTNDGFDLYYFKDGEPKFQKTIPLPDGLSVKVHEGRDTTIGQSIFLDLELTGDMLHLLPVCYDGFRECDVCKNGTIYAYKDEKWYNLHPDFSVAHQQGWGFYKCMHKQALRGSVDTVTLRAGDFNMDGYPDLLATLGTDKSNPQVFLLENVQNKATNGLKRTFAVRWDALASMSNKSTLAAFYDLYQDGILDVIMYGQNKIQAFRNTLDYDANFLKVMVLTGPERGSNLPGPQIYYHTKTQEGDNRAAAAAQLPQSAHFTLGLPYTIFGLGRTPNFVDTLSVGLAEKSRDWPQIIPNSQMVVIPFPLEKPNKWRAQLFITPSKMILLSAVALLGTCGLIMAIIAALYWKERREDRIEKLQEAHRFHFDAM